MKKTLKVLIVLLLGSYSFGQVLNESPPETNMKLMPEGEFAHNSIKVKVNAFWMSEEITNKEYREFINALKANPNDSLGVINPVTITEGAEFQSAVTFYTYSEVLSKATYSNGWGGEQPFGNYFYSDTYDDYPVVGVSFESAKFFCIWKTHQMNNQRKDKGLPQVADFRLPTETEWIYAALGNHEAREPGKVSELGRVKSGDKNKYGLHNLNNNVSEWTSNKTEEGQRIIKGSSWKKEVDTFERIEKPADYRDNSIGFRIVMSYMSE